MWVWRKGWAGVWVWRKGWAGMWVWRKGWAGVWVWCKGWAGVWHAMRTAGYVGVTGNKLDWCHPKLGNLVVFLAHSVDKFPM